MKNLEKLAELAKDLPAGIKEKAETLVEQMGTIIEGISDKPLEWRPPMLKLVQGTSDRSKLPKGAGIGSFVLGEELVDQPFEVIPIRLWTARQYWNPDPEQAKMLCNSPDSMVGFQYGECKLCPYSKYDEEAKKSQCNKTITALCASGDLSKVFLVNFAKTNYMNGVDWQGLMKKAGVAPHKRVYKLASTTSTKSKNVELIKAEPADPNKVDPKLLPFIEELSRLSGDDRKLSLEKFYEYVEMKKANGNNMLAAPPGVVELLSAPSDEVEVIDSDPTTVLDAAPAKTTGKKYSL